METDLVGLGLGLGLGDRVGGKEWKDGDRRFRRNYWSLLLQM